MSDDQAPPRRRVGLVLGGTVIVGLLGAWIYVLFFYDPGLLIDELADRSFPDAAEVVCADAVEELDTLPLAQSARGPEERADAVERSNVIYRGMLRQLRPLVPDGPPQDRAGVSEWIDDWGVYVDRREQYAESLRADPEARFLEPSKGSPTKGITRAINGFAQVNRMQSCETPGDLS